MQELGVNFSNTDWEESTAQVLANEGKLNRTKAAFSYSAGMIGTSQVEYLLRYRADGTGDFTGWEEFTGTFAGKSGSILFRHEGLFFAHSVETDIISVPGSGTGDLANLEAKAHVSMSGTSGYTMTMQYTGL